MIADGNRPTVLGAVVVRDAADLPDALFTSLAHAAAGADGLDLTLPLSASPSEQAAAADQLAEATGLVCYLRIDRPVGVTSHTMILPSTAQARRSANVVFDIAVAAPETAEFDWPAASETRSMLLTAGAQHTDGQLIGLATVACHRRLAAISTDRVRMVRRVVDTVASIDSVGATCL